MPAAVMSEAASRLQGHVPRIYGLWVYGAFKKCR
jgi:hypothetical protein